MTVSLTSKIRNITDDCLMLDSYGIICIIHIEKNTIKNENIKVINLDNLHLVKEIDTL